MWYGEVGVLGACYSTTGQSGLVTMAVGVHPVPSRTRQLSPPAPMVLGGQPPGRVGRCQSPGLCFLGRRAGVR